MYNRCQDLTLLLYVSHDTGCFEAVTMMALDYQLRGATSANRNKCIIREDVSETALCDTVATGIITPTLSPRCTTPFNNTEVTSAIL